MNDNIKYKVNEIFYSLSGEGLSMGMPATFVRFAGCNLNAVSRACIYCDTTYAQEQKQGKDWTLNSIRGEVMLYPGYLVVLTGGEPLWRDGVQELASSLMRIGKNVEIETNGTLPLWDKTEGSKSLRWSMDIKTPCSGFVGFNHYENIQLLSCSDQIKFVVQDNKDLKFVEQIIKEYKPKAQVIIQPSWGKTDIEEIVEWVKSNLPTRGRLGIQLHKYIWGNRRGK